MRKATGSYRTYSIPWFLSLRWKTCLRQNCSLGSCACSEVPVLEQNTLMLMMISLCNKLFKLDFESQYNGFQLDFIHI